MFNHNEIRLMILDRLELCLKPKHKEMYSLDLIVTLKTLGSNIIRVSDNFYLKERKERYQNGFKRSFKVYLHDALVGTLWIGNSLDKRLVKFKVDKSILYSGNWIEAYNGIVDGLGLRFNNISFLEIALDSNIPYTDHLGKIIERVYNRAHVAYPRYRKKTKINHDALRENTYFIIGSSKSRHKVISFYEKKNGEQYQVLVWESVGLNPQDIHRVEVRMGISYLSRLRKIEPWELTLNDTLIALYKKAVGDSLTFYDTEEYYYDKNRNKKFKEIKIIDLDSLEAKEIDFTKMPTKSQNKANRSHKKNWKDLIHYYILKGDQAYLNAANSLELEYPLSQQDKLNLLTTYDYVVNNETAERFMQLFEIYKARGITQPYQKYPHL